MKTDNKSFSWFLELHTYSALMFLLCGFLVEEHRIGKLHGSFLVLFYVVGNDDVTRPEFWYHLN